MNNTISESIRFYKENNIDQVVEQLNKCTHHITAPSEYNIQKTYNTLVEKETALNQVQDGIFEKIQKAKESIVYFHIPFCERRCSYCSFEKVIGSDHDNRMKYFDTLEQEIEQKIQTIPYDLRPVIFYVGGGTPSLLNLDEMKRFFSILSNHFEVKGALEFTYESSVETLNQDDALEKLQFLSDQGVNRINVGVQSLSAEITKMHGRLQTVEEVESVFNKLNQCTFDKVNLDLIYGLLGHNYDIWMSDLEKTISIAPDSITTFELRVRPPSFLYKKREQLFDQFLSDEERIIMRRMALNYFERNGYQENNSDYFIKNLEKKYFYHPAQPENRYRNLIGFGSSAYSLAGHYQITNIYDTGEYMDRIVNHQSPIETVITLSDKDYFKRIFSNALRTQLDINQFFKDYSVSIFEHLEKEIDTLKDLGLIELSDQAIKLTSTGRVIADRIASFIHYS